MKKKANLKVLGLLLIFGLMSVSAFQPMSYAANASLAQSEVININKASADQLESIKGIGPALAQRIVDYRDENGKFERPDDLVNVRGIGQAKLRKIQHQIST